MAFSIAGLGSYLPSRVVTNAEVAELVGINAARIQKLFDVEERRWVRDPESARPMPGLSVADLAAHAARAALDNAGLTAADVDLLVVASTTQEYVSPPLDYRVRRKLGTRDILGFTLHSACTGLFRAAALVDALLATERAAVAVIVTADAISQYFLFDRKLPTDLRMSMALYGDGAGALVVVRETERLPQVDNVTVVSTATTECPGIMFAGPYGRDIDNLLTSDDGARRIGYHDFRRVLEKGTKLTVDAGKAVLVRAGKTFDDVGHILTHQATGNIKGIVAGVGLPASKVHVNIAKVGNTLSASTLILFDELRRSGAFKSGDLLLVCSAESATWSYGGMTVRWQ